MEVSLVQSVHLKEVSNYMRCPPMRCPLEGVSLVWCPLVGGVLYVVSPYWRCPFIGGVPL